MTERRFVPNFMSVSVSWNLQLIQPAHLCSFNTAPCWHAGIEMFWAERDQIQAHQLQFGVVVLRIFGRVQWDHSHLVYQFYEWNYQRLELLVPWIRVWAITETCFEYLKKISKENLKHKKMYLSTGCLFLIQNQIYHFDSGDKFPKSAIITNLSTWTKFSPHDHHDSVIWQFWHH